MRTPREREMACMRREIFSATRKIVLGAMAVLPLAACDGTDAEPAFVSIELTDAPADNIQSAEVWISRVYLQGGPGNATDTTDTASSGRVDLFNNASAPFKADLLALQAGVTANLAQPTSVEPGNYGQLRIVVDSAKVTLKSPFTFEGGETVKSFKIPSGSTSGVKVLLNGAIDAEAGDTTTVLADMDVNANFNIQFAPGSATVIRQIIFTPVIKEKNRSTS